MARKFHSGVTDQAKASRHRLEDSREIFEKAKRWRAAMYMGGYSIECLLKVRLMKQFGCDNLEQLESELRDKQILPARMTIFSHSLEILLRLAGGFDRLRQNEGLWRDFIKVNNWRPAWRYSPDLGTSEDAKDFLDSVERVHHWIDVNT